MLIQYFAYFVRYFVRLYYFAPIQKLFNYNAYSYQITHFKIKISAFPLF